jgi:hypothetical protein
VVPQQKTLLPLLLRVDLLLQRCVYQQRVRRGSQKTPPFYRCARSLPRECVSVELLASDKLFRLLGDMSQYTKCNFSVDFLFLFPTADLTDKPKVLRHLLHILANMHGSHDG